MENSYAQALWKMIQNGSKPKEAVAKLREVLAVRGRGALLPKIARAFARLAARQEASSKMTLTVAREKDARAAAKEVEKILAAHKISDVELCEEVDESLIGGWRLEGRGLLVDTTWKKSLVDMYNAATL